jgi:hypothetical protein
LLDLVRLHPRDTNYGNDDEHQTCVLREKLIKIYNLHQVNPKISLKSLAKFSDISETKVKVNTNLHTQIPLKSVDPNGCNYQSLTVL